MGAGLSTWATGLERNDSAGAAAATTDSDGTGDKWGSFTYEQSVQLDEHMEQQQQAQIPMGQMVLLVFFEPSSQQLPPSPEQTTIDDYKEDESTLIQSHEEESNQMKQ